MTGKITLNGDLIKLWADGRLLDEQPQKNLSGIYCVFAGSEVDAANLDTEFYIFAFSDKLWLLPFETEDVTITIKCLRDLVVRSRLYYFAYLDALPRTWRKSFLRGVIRFHDPQLLVLPAAELPKMRLKGPINPDGLLPLEGHFGDDRKGL